MYYKDMKAGTHIKVLGDGFGCMSKYVGKIVTIKQENDELYVPCDCGKHFLGYHQTTKNGAYPEFKAV